MQHLSCPAACGDGVKFGSGVVRKQIGFEAFRSQAGLHLLGCRPRRAAELIT